MFSTLLLRWTTAASASSLSPFRWLSRSLEFLRPPPPGCLQWSSSKKTLATEIRSLVVDIKTRKEGLIVSLDEIGFYESGASTMRASSVGSVDRLAAVLASRSENMRIRTAHHNLPIHNPYFPANWELSTSRASKLVKLSICISSLLRTCPLRPCRVSSRRAGHLNRRTCPQPARRSRYPEPSSSELIPPRPKPPLLPQFLRQNRLLHPNNRPVLNRLTSPFDGFP
jgi:hypothetical protein